jgi:uncharacterized protein with HEPN domain
LRGDQLRLSDILGRIDRILEATVEGRAKFEESQVIQDAVIRNLEVIGEASAQLSAEVRHSHPELPWRAMIGFRNLASHAYWKIEPPRLWAIVEMLPKTRTQVATIQVSE